ncbi:DUF1800 family protein [Luminiphilus sp.]|nr:DUF1800 family protein [Luminiphilus sp.]
MTLMSSCGGGGAGGASATSTNASVIDNKSPSAVIDSLTSDYIAGRTIELTSASSTDEDGDTLSVQWEFDAPSGSYASLREVDTNQVEFEPDIAGTFTIRLEVTDGRGGVGRTSLNITPSLPTPVALPLFVSTAPPTPKIKDRTDGVRLLYQGTFGPRDGDIDALTLKGAAAWFEEQTTMDLHSYTGAWESIAADFNDIDSGENANFRQLSHETFMLNALSSPDQLRQRMTYALSQMFVISDRFDFAGQDELMMGYADTLHRNAFGNFRDLLHEVTLHPAMGMFLAMLGNEKADPENNIRPDENFAREVMQLFTVGLQLLNQDGSPIIDEETNLPVQTYSPLDVQNYAAALTGWYFADQPSYKFGDSFHSVEWQDRLAPMAPYEDFHQKTQKKLLRNYYVPAGASATESLDVVVDSLFYHPNLGPFVASHLIKNFVSSNPSTDYLARVVAVFNSNADGERGNLSSVVQAVLFDPEARRAPSQQPEHFGRVKDPLLKFVNFNRLFSVGSYLENNNYLGNRPSQTFLGAHSVFNFYSPTYTPNGQFASLGLVAPELQVITPETIVSDASLVAYVSTREQLAYWYSVDPSDEFAEHLKYAVVHDLAPLVDRLETSGLMEVIDFVDEYMTQRQLSASMKNELVEYFSPKIQQTLSANYFQSEIHRLADLHGLLGSLIYQVSLTPEYSLQK